MSTNKLGYMREYYAKNKERVLESNRRYRERDPERWLARARAYHHENREKLSEQKRRHRKENPELYRERLRQNKYGLSTKEFTAMVAAQGGRCAVCGDQRPLVIDHNHDTDEVRALLCSPCNTAIGLFKEDPRRMIAAMAYLSMHAQAAQVKAGMVAPGGPGGQQQQPQGAPG
jgi:hypothetical protein